MRLSISWGRKRDRGQGRFPEEIYSVTFFGSAREVIPVRHPLVASSCNLPQTCSGRTPTSGSPSVSTNQTRSLLILVTLRMTTPPTCTKTMSPGCGPSGPIATTGSP